MLPFGPFSRVPQREKRMGKMSQRTLAATLVALLSAPAATAAAQGLPDDELAPLVARVEAGEDIVIARRGEPVARLVACKKTKGARQPDVLKGKISFPDSFFDPLPEDELLAWEGQ